MMRRYMSTLRVGADLFPTAHSALAPADPWCLPETSTWKSQPAEKSRDAQISAILLKKDFHAGWELFRRSLFNATRFNNTRSSARSSDRASSGVLSSELQRSLLAILPSGAETAHLWWPRAQTIKSELDALRAPLSATDYAVLLNLAAKAGDLGSVEALWTETAERGVVRDTNAWNQYIAAACDAQPQFWPWDRSRSTSFARYQANSALRQRSRLSNRPGVVDLLEQMDLEGVERNARTYELVILALAKDSVDNLDSCEQLALRMWSSPNSSANDTTNSTTKSSTSSARSHGASSRQPGISAVTAVVDAFAFHEQLARGYEIVCRLNDAGGLASLAANRFWTRLLRLVVAQTQPRGNVDREFFAQVWTDMTQKFGYKPRMGEFSIRAEFLESKNAFDTMFADLPDVVRVSGGPRLAQSIATRAAVGLINTGRALEAAKQLESARTALAVLPTRDLEPLLAQHGASLQQLRLYEEDDDEDTII